MTKYAIALAVAYLIGIVVSVSQMAEFQHSNYRHRKMVKAAYLFCWAALVIPVLNIIGGACLWWELRQASRADREVYVDTGKMVFPPFYRAKQGLGEEDEHA